MMAVYVGVGILAVGVNPGFWSLFIGQTVGHMMLASYLVMEHNGLPHEGSILEKTRTIRVPKWVRLLMWNMPYHAEHHA
ncbi:MAG TPA: fatty acid desaturase, partial [Cytophagales bacterium]|nr:fatty acid desaturase [Cytophagales bacterium]